MEHPTPPIPSRTTASTADSPDLGEPAAPAAASRIWSLCENHLSREESLLADMLMSLQQVRDAFFQRNLGILPTLQIRQQQLTQEAAEIAEARERLRAVLADWLGVAVEAATLRAAAQALPGPQRERLLERRSKLAGMLREVDRLSQHNAALLGYARGFFACLFSVGRISNPSHGRYGRQGERHDQSYGPLLQAQV